MPQIVSVVEPGLRGGPVQLLVVFQLVRLLVERVRNQEVLLQQGIVIPEPGIRSTSTIASVSSKHFCDLEGNCY